MLSQSESQLNLTRTKAISLLVVSLSFAVFFTETIHAQVSPEPSDRNLTEVEPVVIDELAVPAPSSPSSPWAMLFPQRSSATGTWLAGNGGDELGISEVNISATFAMPITSVQSVFSVTPGFDVQALNAPAGFELPEQLYRGSLTFSLMRSINECSQLLIGVSPGFASDLETGGGNAFRLPAFTAVTWQYRPSVKLTFGAAATGRDDIPVLPMAGITWTPNDDWQINIAAPRPRIARRITWIPFSQDDWLYVVGEFGGGTWAVERAGRSDELTLRDFRLLLGWERKGVGKRHARFELGYVFGREIEYESDGYDFQPTDTAMVRAGLSF